MKTFMLFLGLSFLFGQTCIAQNMNEGIAAYDRADYKKALEHFLPLADIDFNYTQLRSGENNPVTSPLAQYYLGLMYCLGKGVSPNKETAKEWFKTSHRNGIHRPAILDCK